MTLVSLIYTTSTTTKKKTAAVTDKTMKKTDRTS